MANSRRTPPTYFDLTDYDQVYEYVPPSPEKRLLIAIIQRAMYDYAYPVKGKAHHTFDAAAWLFSESWHVMSLNWICAVLSDYPEHLKRIIRKSAKEKTFKQNSVIFRVDTR